MKRTQSKAVKPTRKGAVKSLLVRKIAYKLWHNSSERIDGRQTVRAVLELYEKMSRNPRAARAATKGAE